MYFSQKGEEKKCTSWATLCTEPVFGQVIVETTKIPGVSSLVSSVPHP